MFGCSCDGDCVCGYSDSVSTIGCWIIAGVVAVDVPTILVANVPETRMVIVRVVVEWRDYGNCAGYSDVSCCESIAKVGGIQKIWTPFSKSQPSVAGIRRKQGV